MDLQLCIFRFHIIFQDEVRLPIYKGSTLRGSIGAVLRRLVCVYRDKNCPDCLLRLQCIYSFVFETPVKDRKRFNTTHLSHPYIIEPYLDGKSLYLPDDTYNFNLILFGRAIDLLPFFILTVEELGKKGIRKNKGKFIVDKVENLHHLRDEVGHVVYNGTQKILNNNKKIINLAETVDDKVNIDSNSLTINFLTPCRIIHRNKLINPTNFTFPIFLKTLLRRLNLLSHLFDLGWSPDYENLLRLAEEIVINENRLYWYDWERYSSRQKTKMKLGGLKGRISFKGDFTPFVSLIIMGEYVHIGKDTSFGLGKYEIE